MQTLLFWHQINILFEIHPISLMLFINIKISNMIISFDFTRVSLHTIMINVHDSSNNQQMIQSSEKGKVL